MHSACSQREPQQKNTHTRLTTAKREADTTRTHDRAGHRDQRNRPARAKRPSTTELGTQAAHTHATQTNDRTDKAERSRERTREERDSDRDSAMEVTAITNRASRASWTELTALCVLCLPFPRRSCPPPALAMGSGASQPTGAGAGGGEGHERRRSLMGSLKSWKPMGDGQAKAAAAAPAAAVVDVEESIMPSDREALASTRFSLSPLSAALLRDPTAAPLHLAFVESIDACFTLWTLAVRGRSMWAAHYLAHLKSCETEVTRALHERQAEAGVIEALALSNPRQGNANGGANATSSLSSSPFGAAAHVAARIKDLASMTHFKSWANHSGRGGVQQMHATLPLEAPQRVAFVSLIECIHSSHGLLANVLARPPFLSLVFAQKDAAALEQARLEIERLKAAVLHAPAEAAADAEPAVDSPLHTSIIMSSLLEELSHEREGALRRGAAQHVQGLSEVRIRINPPSPPAASEANMAAVAAIAAPATAPQAAPAPQAPLTSFKLLRGAPLAVTALASTSQQLPALAPLVSPLSALYALWTHATNRPSWLADFYALLHGLELGFSGAVSRAIQDSAFIEAVATILRDFHEPVETIASRSRFLGVALASQDKQSLESMRDRLLELQRAAVGKLLGRSQQQLDAANTEALRSMAHALEAQETHAIHARLALGAERLQEDALRALLHPIDYSLEIESERAAYCMGTRCAIIERVQEWIEAPMMPPAATHATDSSDATAAAAPPAAPFVTPSRVFWLRGDPGLGKTTLSCVFLEGFPRFFGAVHLCRHDLESRRSPARLIKSIVFQLAGRLAPFKRALMKRLPLLQNEVPSASAAELWDLLLVQTCAIMKADAGPSPSDAALASIETQAALDPSTPVSLAHLLAGHQRLCVLIDALDECVDGKVSGGGGGGGSNSLLQLLAAELGKLPPWLCFLVTSRPEPDIERALSRHAGSSRISLSITDAENNTDVEVYLRQEVSAALRLRDQLPSQLQQQPMDLTRAVQALSEKSKGHFLYARLIIERLADVQSEREKQAAAAASSSSSASAAAAASFLTPADFTALPDGLGALYFEHMQRVAASLPSSSASFFAAAPTGVELMRAVLEIIVCSFEPLSLVSLAKLTDLPSEAALRALLAPLCEGGLFQLQTQTETDPAAKVRYQLALRAARAARRPAPPPDFCGAQQLDYTICLPFHKSIVDWLTDDARLQNDQERAFYVTANHGHRRMRHQCFEELTQMHEEDFSNAASSHATSSSSPAVSSSLAPFLCVDRAANPDTYLPSSSLLSYVLRFGPKHCLAAWSTCSSKDSASESLPPLGSEAFLTRFPFLPAAQFLVHLQYLQMRAALRGDLASLALEYASCEDSGDEWERIMSETPEAMELSAPLSNSSNGNSSTSWLWLSSPQLALQALRDFRFLIRLELKNWRGVGPAELWDVVASESAAETEQAKQARISEQSDGKRLMAGSSSKKFVSLAEANSKAAAAAPTLDCYAASAKAMSRFCCGSIASQFLYASALSFPESSCVRTLGSARFDSWFLGWHLRRVHRVQWSNKPQMLPNLLASLQHSGGGGGGMGSNSGGGGGSGASASQSSVATHHGGSVTSLKIHVLTCSPDGLKIASVCALDRAVRIFHAVSFELLQLIIPSAAASAFTPTTLAWTGDSQLLAVGGYRSPLSLYTAEGGEHVGNTMGSALRGVESCVFVGVRQRGTAAAQRESFSILAGYSNDLEIYSLSAAASSSPSAAPSDGPKTAASLRCFGSSVHQARVNMLRLNADRTLLASAGWDEYVVVWNMGSPEAQAAAAAASEEDSDQARAAVMQWVDSIRPLIVLVPPLSAGLTSRASEVAALVLHFRALAWHPHRRGTLVTASADRGGNGLCHWEVLDAAAEDRAAPDLSFVAAHNPLRALIQTPEQRWDEYLHASFTPTGSHLFVSARGRTTMDVFAEDVAEEGMQLEWIGVTNVADVGRDVSCMDFSGYHEANAGGEAPAAAATTAATKMNSSTGKHVLRRAASMIAATASLKRVVLLTGDTGGQARVWSVEALLNKVHQELPPMSEVEMPPQTAAAAAEKEEEKKEQMEEKAQAPALPRAKTAIATAAPAAAAAAPAVSLDPPSMFPRIGRLAFNSRFLVIADASAAPVLHVYNPATALFLRSIADSVATEMEIQPDAASSKTVREVAELLAAAPAPGAVVSMQLADAASATLAVSYKHFRGIKLWDIARGVLLRVVGYGLVSASVPSLAFNPRSMMQMREEQENTQHQATKDSGDGTLQLLAPEGNLLSLWALPPPPLPLGVRTLFLKPGRALKDSGRRKAGGAAVELQHVSPIIAAAFHPQGSCIASIESAGVLKLWQPGVSDTAAKQAAAAASILPAGASFSSPPVPPHWEKHATILRTHTSLQEQLGFEVVEFTCVSFSPNGSLLAVGGLNPCLTIFNTRASTGGEGSGRGFGKVLWKLVAGDAVALAWSPCSRWLATVDRRHTVSIWRIPRAMAASAEEIAADAVAAAEEAAKAAAAKQKAAASRWGADGSDDSKDASSAEEEEEEETEDDPYDFRAKDNDGLVGREMRLADDEAAREAAEAAEAAAASMRAQEQPVLFTQYINQSLSSGMPMLPLSSYVFLALTGPSGKSIGGGGGSVSPSPSLPASVWFHHAEENCIKVWRAPWMEQPDAMALDTNNAAASAAASTAGSRGGRAAAAALARASSLAPPAPPVLTAPPLSIPILFHSDRLSSSAQPSLIHFLEHQ